MIVISNTWDLERNPDCLIFLCNHSLDPSKTSNSRLYFNFYSCDTIKNYALLLKYYEPHLKNLVSLKFTANLVRLEFQILWSSRSIKIILSVSVWLCACLSDSPSVCLSVYLCLSVYASYCVCVPLRLSICLPLGLCVCVSVFVSICILDTDTKSCVQESNSRLLASQKSHKWRSFHYGKISLDEMIKK